MAVNLSRRWFLGGALAVAGATVLPSLPKAYPRIIGDGIHDDTVGLQAALDGKAFMCGDQVMCGAKEIVLKRGVYRLTAPLRISKSVELLGEHDDKDGLEATLVAEHDGALLAVDGDVTLTLAWLCLQSKGPGPCMELGPWSHVST